jgi:hypothetical protein
MIDLLRDEVTQAVRFGRHLDEIDAEVISSAPVSTDAKAALWLWAFCQLLRSDQHALASDSLRAVVAG